MRCARRSLPTLRSLALAIPVDFRVSAFSPRFRDDSPRLAPALTRFPPTRNTTALCCARRYQRRSKNDPLWNELLIAGVDDYADVSGMQRSQPTQIDAQGVVKPAATAAASAAADAPRKPFLGRVDKLGMSYEEDFIATGFGLHLAVPLLRTRWVPGMTQADAQALLEDCMRVLYYRDCRTINRIQFATIVADVAAPGGSKLDISEVRNLTYRYISCESVSQLFDLLPPPLHLHGRVISHQPYALPTKWDYATFVAPKAGTDTGGSW